MSGCRTGDKIYDLELKRHNWTTMRGQFIGRPRERERERGREMANKRSLKSKDKLGAE